MVLIEAQACGTPVIGSNVGGIPSALKDGYSGYLSEPKNSADIANKITRIISNYNYFSKNSIEYAKKFDINKISNKTYFLFKKVKEDTFINLI
jgi:glycosyltransferase involved in cell wall biosynthesis